MARDHLRAGHDVVVAQLYGQPDHLDELAAAANELGVRYLEIVLMTDVTSTLERFTQRRGPRLEDALQAPKGLGTIVELHERVADLARARERTKVVMSIPNDIAATYEALLEVTTDINPSTA